ncbi:MAG: protein-tyrosine-phosphatase [Saprospiraceae bacterium]|nr:protein-tyrosine-phosphatase [Saprospiraceae bacterium]
MQLRSDLSSFVEGLIKEVDLIPSSRKEQLQQLASYVDARRSADRIALNFICTHNSRRSHLAQIWAATAAYYYGVSGVKTFSGGTEATAFNPRAVAAMKRAGFLIEAGEGDNPVYAVSYAEAVDPLQCFSKVYDHPTNPPSKFAAIMTCSDADENCPFIPGVELRLPLTYEDPKVADDTPEETARYDERVRQIGREIFYAFSLVNE